MKVSYLPNHAFVMRCVIFNSAQLPNIFITFVQCWTNGPTLNKYSTNGLYIVFAGLVDSFRVKGRPPCLPFTCSPLSIFSFTLRGEWLRSNFHFAVNENDQIVEIIVVENASQQPFKSSRCIKASFYIPENTLNFPTTEGFRTKIPMKLFYQYMAILFKFKPHHIIFIHYKSRIATAIRGL